MTRRGSSNQLSFFTLFTALLPLICSLILFYQTANFIPLLVYSVMSGITFGLYRIDKNRAVRGEWRISESTLHLCEFFGGWAGGLLAQQIIRHKTQKGSFQIVFWLIVISHLVFWSYLLIFQSFLINQLISNESKIIGY